MSIPANPSHRIAKLKLIKDLKYGKIHLRQSLLQMSEFEDIDKIFKNRKQVYSIEDLENVHIQKIQPVEQQEQINYLISPIQRMELFRKQKINKKLKEKMMNSLAKQTRANKPRVPKTSKMLQKFQQKYRNEMPISYKQQLRQSELNLQKIKRNDKTRFETGNQTQKHMYHSRIFLKTQDQSVDNNSPRKRFVSLKTSLPQKDKFIYESIRQIMQGKQNQNIKGPAIDIKSIQNSLDNYLNNTLKRMRIKIEKDVDFRNTVNSPLKMRQRASSRQHQNQQRQKIKSNVQRSFTRSQESSKHMINTMSSFYQTKHQKKDNFNKMVKNLKYDRPLTSSIRRKNYTVLGKQTLSPITDYRQMSQQQRIKIRTKNYNFYCKLIEGLQIYHQQDIPTTVYIVEQVKRIFQTQYMLTQDILQDLIDSVNLIEVDHKTEDILNQLASFVGVKLIFSPHSSILK